VQARPPHEPASPRRPRCDDPVRLASPSGRWVIAAVVLGSAAPFVEGTAVNVALPAIGASFDLGITGIQWMVNSYLLTLGALILLGGALGDRHGYRWAFLSGLAGFGVASLLCTLAPTVELLLVARVVQGAAGALLVPASLAVVNSVFVEGDRPAAVGMWAGWSAVATAFGPFLGGWLVDAGSWRLVFASVVPLVAVAVPIALRHLPEARVPQPRRLDVAGSVLVTLGLGGVVYALVEGPRAGFTSPEVAGLGLVGVVLLGVFAWEQRRNPEPLLPPALFASRQFAGANLVTLLCYAALGGALFFLMLQLQNVMGYRAVVAGAALVPLNVAMVVLSPMAGRVTQRIGPTLPTTVGPLVSAGGFVLLAGVRPGVGYVTGVLPGVVVFGVGLAILVAPLTAAVLAAVPAGQAGIGSGVNNAVARLAGLLAGAALPWAAGLGGIGELSGPAFAAGYRRAMGICAVLCLAGAVVAAATIRRAAPVRPHVHPAVTHGCSEVQADTEMPVAGGRR